MRFIVFLFAFILCSSVQAADGVLIQSGDKNLELDLLEFNGETYKTVVTNKSNMPYIVRFTAGTDKSMSEIVLKQSEVIEPNSTKTFELIPLPGKKIVDPRAIKWSSGGGDLNRPKEADNFSLPFQKDTVVRVCQYFDGPQTTHAEKESIDFCVPLDTVVTSAKDGVVYYVVDKYTAGGTDPSLKDKANLIEILHEDGSISSYAHLKRNSILVKAGDRVKKGQPIGQVGLTGYTSGPHLHFDVCYLDKDIQAKMIQPIFRDQSNKILRLSFNETINPNSKRVAAGAKEVSKIGSDSTANDSDKSIGALNMQKIAAIRDRLKQKVYPELRGDIKTLQIMGTSDVPGSAEANYLLSGIFYNDSHGLKNLPESFKYVRTAALQGHKQAQLNLGGWYAMGWGTKQNYPNALLWTLIGYQGNPSQSAKNIAVFKSKLTESEIKTIERKSKECLEVSLELCS